MPFAEDALSALRRRGSVEEGQWRERLSLDASAGARRRSSVRLSRSSTASGASAGLDAAAPRFSMDSDYGSALLPRSSSLSEPSSDGWDAPAPRASLLSVPRDALATPRHTSPPPRRVIDTDALVRLEYHKRIATQVLLSSLAPSLHYLSCCVSDSALLLSPRARGGARALSSQHVQAALRLPCGVLSLCLLALASFSKARPLLPPRWRAGNTERVMVHLIRLETLTYAVINLCGFIEFHALRDANCPGASAFACGQRYLLTFHTAILPKWIISQMTGRFVFFPEVLRNAAFAAGTLALSARDGSLTPALAALVLLEALACLLYGMLAVKLCRALVFEDRHLPRWETCPARLRAARERLVTKLERLVAAVLDEPVLDFHAISGVATSAVLLCTLVGDTSLCGVSAYINVMFLTLLLTSLASKLAGGTTHGLWAMSRRLGLRSEQRLLFDLRVRLAGLPSESAILRAAADALQLLLPGASAVAVATFLPEDGGGADGVGDGAGGCLSLSGVEGAATSEGARVALEAALAVGAAPGSSVAFACSQAAVHGSQVAWSGDFPSSLAAFADWRAAARAGLSGQALTAPLAAGPALLGFAVAHFSAGASADELLSSAAPAVCCDLADIVGASLYSLRAARALQASQRVVADIYPEHVARALESRYRNSNSSSVAGDAAAAAAAATAAAAEEEDAYAAAAGEAPAEEGNAADDDDGGGDASAPADSSPTALPPVGLRVSDRTSLGHSARSSSSFSYTHPPRRCSAGGTGGATDAHGAMLNARHNSGGGATGGSELFAEAFSSVTIVFAGALLRLHAHVLRVHRSVNRAV
jgi:hypothetical protein